MRFDLTNLGVSRVSKICFLIWKIRVFGTEPRRSNCVRCCTFTYYYYYTDTVYSKVMHEGQKEEAFMNQSA